MHDSDLIAYWRRRHELAPESRAFAPLADLIRRAGRPGEALGFLEAGLERHPRFLAAWLIKARCHLAADRPGPAREALQRALAIDPDNLQALRLLADLARSRGETGEAVGLLERLAWLDPADREAAGLLGELRGAVAAPATGAAVEAAAAAGAAAAADRSGAAPESGSDPGADAAARPQEAQLEARSSAPEPAAAPGPPAAAPEPPAAAARPRAAASSPRPTPATATPTLADIYRAQGHLEKALEVLRQVLVREPDHKGVREEIEALEREIAERGRQDAPGAAGREDGFPAPGRRQSREHFERWIESLGGRPPEE